MVEEVKKEYSFKKFGVKLSCQHCGNLWVYTGKQELYATCSVCLYKVNINKRVV